MVACVRLDEPRELAGFHPVELAAVDDDTAERRAVTADKLRCGVDDDIRAVIERAKLVRRCKRGVDDEWNVVSMGDFCHGFDVDEVCVRVADGLDVDKLRIVFDGLFKGINACFRINERRRHTEIRECMREKVVRTAVDRRCCNDMVTCMGKSLESRRDCSCARSKGKRRDAALKRCHTAL